MPQTMQGLRNSKSVKAVSFFSVYNCRQVLCKKEQTKCIILEVLSWAREGLIESQASGKEGR